MTGHPAVAPRVTCDATKCARSFIGLRTYDTIANVRLDAVIAGWGRVRTSRIRQTFIDLCPSHWRHRSAILADMQKPIAPMNESDKPDPAKAPKPDRPQAAPVEAAPSTVRVEE